MTKVFTSPGTFPLPTLVARRPDLSRRLVASVTTSNVLLVHGAEGVGKSILVNLCSSRLSKLATGPLLIISCREGWTIGSCLLAAGRLLEESGIPAAVALLGSPDRTPANGIRTLVGIIEETKAMVVVDNCHFLSDALVERFISEARKGLEKGRMLFVSRKRLRKETYSDTKCSTFEVSGLFENEEEIFSFPPQLTDRDILSIYSALDNHPLSIYLFSILLALNSLPFDKLLKEIVSASVEAKLVGGIDSSERSDSDEEDTTENHPEFEKASWLFRKICYFLTDNERSVLERLACYRVKVPLHALLDDNDRLPVIGSVMVTLVKCGLISVVENDYEMHSVLRDIFRQSIPVESLVLLHKQCALSCQSLAGEAGSDDSKTVLSSSNDSRSMWWFECFNHCLECSDFDLLVTSLENCADYLEHNGMLVSLLSCFEVCVEIGLNLHIKLYLQRARILRLLGRLDEAASELAILAQSETRQKYVAMIHLQEGIIFQDRNSYEGASSCYYKALEAARKASEKSVEGQILNRIATIAKDKAEYARARNFYLQGIKAAKAGKDYDEVYFAIHNLARICFFQGMYEQALNLYTDLLFGKEYEPGLETQALARNGMGEVLRCQGKLRKARELFSHNEAYYRGSGNRFGLAFTLRNQGELDLVSGYFDRARSRFIEANKLSQITGNVYGEASSHKYLGCLSTMLGDIPDGAKHFKIAREKFSAIGNKRGVAQIYFHESSMEMASSSLNKALECLEKSLEIREEIGDFAGLAWVLFEKGNLSLYRGEYYVADRLYSRGLRKMKKLTDLNGEAACLAGLAKVSMSTGHYDKAMERFQEALDKLLIIEDVVGRSSILIDVGNLSRLRGDYGSAMASYEEALSISPSSVLSLNQADAIDGIALIKSDQGSINESEELFRRSLLIRRRMEGTLAHASILSNLASIEGRLGNFNEEKSLLEQSFRILKALENKREIQKTLGCLATIERNRGNYDGAEAYVKEAYRYGREISDRRGMAIALQQSAQLKLHKKEFSEAGMLFESSLAIKRQIEDTRGITATLCAMGEMYLSMDIIERAADLFAEASEIADEHGYDGAYVEAQLGKAEIEMRIGNFASASAIADSISNLLDEKGSTAGQSAGLSRIWALLAVKNGKKDDAIYLMNFARDLYKELGQIHSSAKVDEEISALSKDTLLENLDRRINIIEELEAMEIIDSKETDGIDDSYHFCSILAFEMKDLSRCSLVFPPKTINKDLLWQGERGGLFLQFFTHSRAAVKSLKEIDCSYISRLVAHGGMANIRAGIAGGEVATLPFRIISTVSEDQCVMSGPFVGGTDFLDREGFENAGEIIIREQIEPLKLYSIPLSRLSDFFV